MFNKELATKIDNIIKEKFPIIYDYKFDGIVLIYGGTIRSLIMNIPVKDFDFIILTQGACQIKEFIRKFKLKYCKNAGGGYKISYNNFTVDMASYNDLLDATVYDADMIFYDIEKHIFISCGGIKSFQNRMVTEINPTKVPIRVDKTRLKKIVKFIKFISNDNGKVKVRRNKLSWEFRMLKKHIKINFNHIFNGNFRKCFRFLHNCKKEYTFIIILGILMSLVSVFIPALSGMLVNEILGENYRIIFILVASIFLLKIFNVFFSYFFSKLYFIVRKKMVFNIRKELAKCVLNFEMDSFSNNSRGTFIDKLRSDPNEIAKSFNGIKDILIKGLGNLGVILYILYLDYRIGIILLIFMAIIFKLKMIGINKRRNYQRKYYITQERYTGVLGEMINGVGDIKSLDLKNNYMKIAEESFETVGENEYLGDSYRNFYNKLSKFVEIGAFGVVLLLGLYFVSQNSLSPSSLIIIFMYNSSVFVFLDRLGVLANLFSDLNVSCRRIFNLMEGNLYIKEVFGNKYKKKCNGKIEFSSVKFKYNYKNDYVLNDCTFKVEPNELIALVGKSGEGKSTVLNLIGRLYNVDQGSIKIDDIVIDEYNEEFIRENISIISQNPYLFDMSIKGNLKLVDENISDKEIRDVCKLVCMDEYIESLPDKYDTVIGEGGIKLSGGQKQRLGIARALIKKTKIILLDEITSALDNETGSTIKKVIQNIKKNHTIILVTHELSMIKDCSKILVLEDGKIVVEGSHEDLINKNTEYTNLYKMK